MAKLVSGRYSEAFFGLAQQSGNMERFADSARLIFDMLDKGEESTKGSFSDFLFHPQISERSKISVVEASLKGKVNDEIIGLIVVMIKKQRESELRDVLESFLKMIDEHNELAEAHVTSAVPIDEGRLETIRGILCEKFGKKVVIKTSVDKDLIGGFRVMILGYSFDRTVRTSINELIASIN